MLRFRFATGLTLGLVLGLAAGALLALLLAPPPAADRMSEIQIQELTRKLDAATGARERADRQLEQFQKLAEQMTASFQSLETRFKAMAAELERRQQAEGGVPPAAPTPAP